MPCRWCDASFTARRRDAEFCSRKCRQAAFRIRIYFAELSLGPAPATGALRLALADPPYPGLARRYYAGEDSYAGEVDHPALLRQLTSTYDGWALCTSMRALQTLLPLCPLGTHVAPWVKPIGASTRTHGPHVCWEPLLVWPGRRLRPGLRDWLSAQPARYGGTLMGRKPLAWVAWAFAMLGARPAAGHTLTDLFPGTGIIGRAWRELARPSAPAQLSLPG